MTGSFFITGSYTEQDSPAKIPEGKGIALYKFDSTSGTCELQSRIAFRNPSYPRYFKETGRIYAAEELMNDESPVLALIEWNGSKGLSIVETIEIPGSHSCHLDICKGYLAIANYTSGDISLLNLADKTVKVIKHEGKSVDADRQESPHPHMVHSVSDSLFLVPDLGLDKILIYEYRVDGQWRCSKELDTPLGSGPRHLIFSKDQNFLMVVGELLGNVLLYKKSDNTYQLIDEVKLTNGPASTAAIRLHPSGKYFYVSERATNTIFALTATDGRLKIIGSFDCGGDTPRDISIDPSGQWILASNQDSNTIAIFRIDPESGILKHSHNIAEPTPVCVSWL